MPEKRRHDRYPAWLPARVGWEGTADAIDGTIIDISHGGAAIETAVVPASLQIELVVTFEQAREYLPMEIVQANTNWYGVTLHARFGPMTPRQQAMVAAIVDTLKREQRSRLGWQ